MGSYVLAFVTCPSSGEAEDLARKVLDARLAAGVNVVGGVRTYFHAEQKIDCSDESLLVIRTTRNLVDSLTDFICMHHPEDVPDLVVSPVVAGANDYLNRVNTQTRNF